MGEMFYVRDRLAGRTDEEVGENNKKRIKPNNNDSNTKYRLNNLDMQLARLPECLHYECT